MFMVGKTIHSSSHRTSVRQMPTLRWLALLTLTRNYVDFPEERCSKKISTIFLVPARATLVMNLKNLKTKRRPSSPTKRGGSSLVVVLPTQPLSQIEWSVGATAWSVAATRTRRKHVFQKPKKSSSNAWTKQEISTFLSHHTLDHNFFQYW